MKRFKYLFMAMFAIACSVACVACGNDDDEEATEAVRSSKIAYSLSLGDEMLSIADITIYYIGMDGVEHEEVLTSNTWSKEFKESKFDVSAGVVVAMQLKTGVELTKDSYNINYTFTYSAESIENGRTIQSKSLPNSYDKNVSAAKVEEYFKQKTIKSALKIGSDGKISSTELSWKNNFI